MHGHLEYFGFPLLLCFILLFLFYFENCFILFFFLCFGIGHSLSPKIKISLLIRSPQSIKATLVCVPTSNAHSNLFVCRLIILLLFWCEEDMAEELNSSLEYTSTWVVAVVCFVIVLLSLCAERALHKLGKVSKFLVFVMDTIITRVASLIF